MNDHSMPVRYKALLATNIGIGVTGIVLRPIYPKSIYIAMFVMSVALAALSVWMVLLAWKQPSTSRRGIDLFFIVALTCLGASAYGIYLTLRSILR